LHGIFFELLSKIDIEEIKSVFEFKTVNCVQCFTCGSKRREVENIEIFLSPSNINGTAMCGDGVKFNELITKPSLRKQVCCNCDNSETIHEIRRELIFPAVNQYVCVLLPLFADDGNRYKQRKILQFDSNNLKIGNHRFRVLAAVMHTGDTPYSGHYTSIVRHDVNKWLLIDDMKNSFNNIRQRFVGNLENVYCAFLERKS